MTEPPPTTGYSLSRQGSFSARSNVPIPALMASLEASRATAGPEQQQQQHLAAAPSSFSRQSSRTDSVESPFGATSGELQRSESGRGVGRKVERRGSVKHSESGYRLERKVSFHTQDSIIGQLDENGQPQDGEKKKKKRTKEEKEARKREKEEKREKKEAKRRLREMSVDRKPEKAAAVVGCGAQEESSRRVLEQVSAKLHTIQAGAGDLPALPPSSLLPSTANNYTPNTSTASSQPLTVNNGAGPTKPRKGPAPQPPAVVDNLVDLREEASADSVVLRDHAARQDSESRNCSKRNSLDNKSVQSLAKDLAAECAKAYELMESSLSKLTNDFSIGPFGLTPKTKVRLELRVTTISVQCSVPLL